MNYDHLVYEMQMASAARAWMYRQPQEDLENFVSGVNGFLNQAEADMRNRGVEAMLCPYIYCLIQNKFAQQKNNFHHLVTRGFTKKYTCWNKHGEEGLNELETGFLNEGEVRHHATDHDEDLDDSGVFEENESLFPPNVLSPEDSTNQEVRGFDDGEVL
jgi:acyl-homoserine lactone acylase PvdQ